MAIANKISVVLTASTKKFNDAIQKSSEKVHTLAEKNKSLGQSLNNLVGAVKNINPLFAAVGAAAIGAGAGILRITTNAAKAADALDGLAEATGTSVEFLSRLDFASEQYGLELNQLTPALRRLARYQAEGAQGNKLAAKEFGKLGISVEELKRLSPEELFMEVAEGMTQIPSAAERTNIGFKIIADNILDLQPLLLEGKEGLQKLFEESDRVGRTVSGRFARQSVSFVEAMRKIKSVTSGAAQSLAVNYLPALTEMIEQLAGLVEEGLPAVSDGFLKMNWNVQRVFAAMASAGEQFWAGITGQSEKEAMRRAAAYEAVAKQTFEQFKAEMEARAAAQLAADKAEREARAAEEKALAAKKAAAEERMRLQDLIDIIMWKTERPRERDQVESIYKVGKALDEVLLRPFDDATMAANEFLFSLEDMADAKFGRIVGFTNRLTSALVETASGGKLAFHDFFKQLLRDIGAAIARALILRFLLGAFTGAGFGNFFKDVGNIIRTGAMPAPTKGYGRGTQDVTALVTEKGEDNVMQAPSIGDLPKTKVDVHVHNAGPMAEIEYFERVIRPRYREVEQDLGGVTR